MFGARCGMGSAELMIKRICVFCGASPGNDPVYRDVGYAIGRDLARYGIGVVYGGASIGVMGAVADGALSAGGEVIGVIPEAMTQHEVSHSGLTALHVVDNMHQRKAMMADLSDAFLALPGGIGTLEELFEVWTWGQLGYHNKPLGLLNVENYWAALELFLDDAAAKGFLRPNHRSMVKNEEEIDVLVQWFKDYTPPKQIFVTQAKDL